MADRDTIHYFVAGRQADPFEVWKVPFEHVTAQQLNEWGVLPSLIGHLDAGGKRSEDIEKKVEFVMARGADLNFCAYGGLPPLHEAIRCFMYSVAQCLLSAGANPNLLYRPDSWPVSPLDLACDIHPSSFFDLNGKTKPCGSPEFVRQLVGAGAWKHGQNSPPSFTKARLERLELMEHVQENERGTRAVRFAVLYCALALDCPAAGIEAMFPLSVLARSGYTWIRRLLANQ